MDAYIRAHLCIFPHFDDGTQHVPDRSPAAAANGSVLRNQMDCHPWFPGTIFLHIRGNHVLSEKNTGEKSMAGEISAAKSADLMSL